MAAAVVGEAFLSATVEFLLKNIASSDFQRYFKNRKLNVSLLGELETTLLALQAVLDDAEEKQITNPAVKDWLDKLKDAVFDAEDLLEEIGTDSLRCKVEAKPQSATRKVWEFFSSPFNQFYRQINSKMAETSQMLKSFEKRKDILGLQNVSARITRRNPTTSLVNESVVVGRKKDEEKLLDLLLSNNNANGISVGVVTILGMGGVGKTTFAQLLYNNKEVQEHFDLKAWACVSEDFDVTRLIKCLLESVTSTVYDSDNLDYLQVELKQKLRNKKFLFVLDDLWNDKYNDWDDLRTPFSNGKTGSRVIITTRQQRVAEVTHTFPIYKLEPLSDEDCWFLLAKHAFGSEDPSRYPNLEVIGKNIAKKCDGLPIAAKTLGGLLRSKLNLKEWERILNSNIWDLTSGDILPALRLSYLYLPTHLKRCFAYCSICPKDYPLDRKQLVLLWMAEGLVQESEGEKSMEEIGDDYFVELLSRSLIQQSKDANRDCYVMHDLVNDLARVVSGKSCFRFEYGEIPEHVRHLSYDREYYDSSNKFENFYKLKCLRSFIPLSSRWWVRGNITRKVVDDLLPALKWLRVLSLSKYRNITNLPNSIGNLVHLRYLNLSHTNIKSLPDTVCMLYNLQTLLLSECYLLTNLPLQIGKLIKLRHLDISGTKIKMMPTQIGELQNLRTLTTFIVGRQPDGLRVGELRKLPHLKGKLSILNLHNVVDTMDAFEANLKGREKIDELVLGWGNSTEDSQMEKDVLDQLQPSTNLNKLTIELYGGTSFPSWVGDSSFSNMISLCISNCEYCVTLPPLGQLPSLKELSVIGMNLDIIGPEFYGKLGGSNSSFQPFPSLEHLKFEYMSNWEEWLPYATDQGSQFPFPHLKSVRLLKCPKLRKHLPRHLPSLTEVEISGCFELLAITSTLHWITSIKRLNIVGGGPQWSLPESDSQCLLQQVRIENCDSLTSLPKMILNSNYLQQLILHGMPSLASFPASGLPTSLRSLRIVYCKNLAFLPLESWCNYTSLEALEIKNSCHSLTSFPLDNFPALKDLTVCGCTKLQSLPMSEPSAWQQSSRLQSLYIHDCKILRSLPERTDTLTALQTLSIWSLPDVESFPQGGLPPNIQSFFVVDCGNLSARGVANWGLQWLTSLSHFEIGGDNLVNALLMEPLLPTSLVSLQISFLSDMKSLGGNGLRHLTSLKKLEIKHCQRLESLLEDELQHLTSLKQLWIRDCPRLESLPEDGLQHLTSLKKLNIIDCPRLGFLPGDKLPPFLAILSIRKCPLLEAKYQSQRREHWSKIAHIPVIDINSKVII